MMTRATALMGVALMGAAARPVVAQQIALTPDLVAQGGAGSATTRAPGAYAINPALLGLSSSAVFTILMPSVSALVTAAPVGPSAFTPFDGQLIPIAAREAWLKAIQASGDEHVGVHLGVRPLGIQVGSVAVTVSTIADVAMHVPPGAAQLALFGNAGRTGSIEDVAIAGGSAHGAAATVIAASFGHTIGRSLSGGTLSLGVTPKYVLGHGMADVSQMEANLNGTEGTLNGQALMLTWGDSSRTPATGYGLDAGAAWYRGRFTVGLAVSDVVNTMQFHAEDAYVRHVVASASKDSSTSETTEGSLMVNGARDARWSAAIGDRAASLVADARFSPTIRTGVRAAIHPLWDVVADVSVHTNAATSLGDGEAHAMAIGTELRPWGPLTLRGGTRFAQDAGDHAVSHHSYAAGAGLRLGGLRLDLAAEQQRGPGAEQLRVAAGVLFTLGAR